MPFFTVICDSHHWIPPSLLFSMFVTMGIVPVHPHVQSVPPVPTPTCGADNPIPPLCLMNTLLLSMFMYCVFEF